MLTAPTIEHLQALKLDTMAPILAGGPLGLDKEAEALVEGEGGEVGLLLLGGPSGRMRRALQEAKLKLSQACIEAVDYPARRELDKTVIRQLATCRWIAEHHYVILVGATGVGKSFIACALAHRGGRACRAGGGRCRRRGPG